MVCPVCVVGGVVAISCRFLGVPDAVTASTIGMLAGTLAIVMYIKVKEKRTLPKYSAVAIWAVFWVFTMLSLKLAGMW